MEISPLTFRFIAAHRREDPVRLRLSLAGKKVPGVDVKVALTQIECRRRAGAKLPVLLECPQFIFPSVLAAEQCSSEALARFHASLVEPGSRILDLTAGLGVDALAMVKRGAEVTAVETLPGHAEALEWNAKALDVRTLTVVNDEASHFLSTLSSASHWDTIFIDPARRDTAGRRTYGLRDCSPCVLDLMPLLRRHADALLLKASPMLDVTQTLRELPGATDLYLLGLGGECKELFCRTDLRTASKAPAQIHIRNLTAGGEAQTFTFPFGKTAEPRYFSDKLHQGLYIYEPSAPLMKVAAIAPIGERYPALDQLGPGTWVYTSSELYPDFPGRITRITSILNKKELTALRGEQYNVVCRNHPLTPAQIKARYHIRDGSDRFLYCLRTTAGPIIISTEPV